MKNRNYKLLIIICLLFAFVLPVYAQQTMSGVVIHSSNIFEYKGKIPLELYPLVKNSGLVMDFVTDLKFQVSYGENWKHGQEDIAKIDENGKLKQFFPLENGFLFELNDETIKGDQKKLIEKILWNIQSVYWSKPLSRYQFNIKLLQDEDVVRELQGESERLYNWRLVADDKTSQFFREIVTLKKPSVLENYTWLTYRFFGQEEDMVWVYSPAIKNSRELTGSNRSDEYAGVIALDDFFLWSGKLENVEGSDIKEVEILIPFATNAVASLQTNDSSCFSIKDTFSLSELQTRWNYGSRKYAQGASWLPTDAIYALRKAYKIDLFSRDPFSQYGRQTLYVDTESMLPVYKFVYDRSGKLWKTLIMFYGFAKDKNAVQVPYPSQMLVIDDKKSAVAMVDYFDAHYCTEFPSKYDLSKFDPRKMGKKE